jgi:hypothetical protein
MTKSFRDGLKAQLDALEAILGTQKKPSGPTPKAANVAALTKAFDVWFSKHLSGKPTTNNVWLNADGFNAYVRVQIAAHPKNGFNLPFRAAAVVCVANVIADGNSDGKRRGKFTAFMNHVEKLVLSPDKPLTIKVRGQPSSLGYDGGTPILGVMVESISNQELKKHLQDKRGFVSPLDHTPKDDPMAILMANRHTHDLYKWRPEALTD